MTWSTVPGMTPDAIFSGVLITLLGGIAWALLVAVWRGSFPATRIRVQRWREVSRGLAAEANRAPSRVAEVIRYGDPVWYPGGPNGELYQEAESMMRMADLISTAEAIETLLPEVAGYYSFATTALAKELVRTCRRAWRRDDDDNGPVLADQAASLGEKVARAATSGTALGHMIGFGRRKRTVERYEVLTGLLEAAANAVHAVAERVTHGDPEWFSGPNGEQWQTSESMIRMGELGRVRETLESFADRAAELGWLEPSREAKALSFVCASIDARRDGGPLGIEDIADLGPTVDRLRSALDALPRRVWGRRAVGRAAEAADSVVSVPEKSGPSH